MIRYSLFNFIYRTTYIAFENIFACQYNNLFVGNKEIVYYNTLQHTQMDRLLNTNEGNIIISIIWGLGLAFLFFKQTCKGEHCIVYAAPPIDDMKNNIYAHKDNASECYKYKPYTVNCDKSKTQPIKNKKHS